jgi:hypothetical protein
LQPVNAFLGYAMPPRYELQVKLGKAVAEWDRVVGPLLAERSAPADLSDGELLVIAETPLVASRLSMMGGNISRALLEYWRLEIEKVRVVVGRLPPKNQGRRDGMGVEAPRPAFVNVKEEEVAALERSYLEKSPALPEDVARSLARLQAFFTKRFGGR